MNLTEIGAKYGTLKNVHISFGTTMLDIYDSIFQFYKNRKLRFLEIGILDGASIKTWKEYFNPDNDRDAIIYGIDISEKSVQYVSSLKMSGVQVFKCDQSSTSDLENLTKITGNLDIVIDDGSHINELTLNSFYHLWPYINKGGLYIIEDMLCTHDKASIDWPNMQMNNPEVNFNNDRNVIDAFILKHLKEMDYDQSDIYTMNFYRNLLIIQKAW